MLTNSHCEVHLILVMLYYICVWVRVRAKDYPATEIHTLRLVVSATHTPLGSHNTFPFLFPKKKTKKYLPVCQPDDTVLFDRPQHQTIILYARLIYLITF